MSFIIQKISEYGMSAAGTVAGYTAQGVVTGIGYAGYGALKGVSYLGSGLQAGAEFMAPVVKDVANGIGSKLNDAGQYSAPKAWTVTGHVVSGLVNTTCYLAPIAGSIAYYTGSALLTATEQTVIATLSVTGVGLKGVGALKHANSTNTLISLIGSVYLGRMAYDEKDTKKKIAYGVGAAILLFA